MMPHRTITISEEAYKALTKAKSGKESFTDVILRISSGKGDAASLLNYLKRMPPSEELAESIEVEMKRTRKSKMRKVTLT